MKKIRKWDKPKLYELWVYIEKHDDSLNNKILLS